MKAKKSISFILVLAAFMSLTTMQAFAAPSDSARASLKTKLNNVTGAVAKKFNAKDDVGNTMDTAKIISNPAVSGQFLAVYHTYKNGTAKVNLATSTDLLNWTFVKSLAGSTGNDASQPSIKVASDGGYVVAWEQEPNNHVKVAYYPSWTSLQSASPTKSYDIPRNHSNYAEGTPNIYSASSTSVDIGFHYFKNGDVDRQARGTLTNFSSWSSSTQTNFDNALLHWGVAGNIGDRDGKLNFGGYDFGLIEGQFVKNDWSTFRSFIYDYSTGNAEQLNPVTPNGSTALANPTFTVVNLNGVTRIVVSMFIFSEGAGSGESGQLIYYFNV
ncbi:hypothetical protein ACFOQM_14365 [Paenibacillus sp. GCM10012307]|uniref:Glycosyl hydrolase family 32 N-terminal domain-containing protein n=1 Tax=Paenibacillus roseus TaxID=2798579 RepID=A0A934J8T5_9BACL|nr:hypothetical protein [Paenibacillus roseus]MBJ6362465.1 hypothetical protein [Paenibacillus roseus]